MEKLTEEAARERVTEEAARKRVTEEAARERVTDANAVVFWITLQLLTFGLMGFGWRLPVEFQKRNVNVKIPGYIWLCCAAFHVIGDAIWLYLTIYCFRLKFRISTSTCLVFLGVCLISSLLFIWFCLTR